MNTQFFIQARYLTVVNKHLRMYTELGTVGNKAVLLCFCVLHEYN